MDSGTNQPIETVGIFRNPYIPAAVPLAQGIARAVRQSGAEVWESQWLDKPDVGQRIPHTDLLITLGEMAPFSAPPGSRRATAP